MERRDFLLLMGVETTGLAVGGAGVVDRILTPAPRKKDNSKDPFSTMEYNMQYRFRSTLLLAIGASISLSGIAAFITSRMDHTRPVQE